MQSLAQRYADRAARKEANAKLAEPDNTGNDRVGNVLAVMVEANAAAEALSSADQAELRARLQNGQATEGYVPTVEGLTPFAGIGVPNPFVVPSGALGGNGGGSGAINEGMSPADAASAAAAAIGADLPKPTDAASGAAQTEQDAAEQRAADAWGQANPSFGGDAYEGMTVAQLKADLDGREPPVKYETDANKARLQELARAK